MLSLLALVGFATQGCLKDKCERKLSYIRVDPVYKTIDEIRNGTAVNEAPRELKNPGALYYYNDKIFINERQEGIHVIDNTDPSSPVNEAFIAIPGNESFAIKNGILYANSYIDLLAIDLQSTEVVGRTESVFPPLWEDFENNRVAVSYQETPVTEVLSCDGYGKFYFTDDRFFDFSNMGGFQGDVAVLANESSNGGTKEGSGAGIGGSMARFTIVGDYLYVVDQTSLDVFSLSTPTQPQSTNTVEIGWGIETIFPFEDKLFIGSNAGMFIYDNSNPAAPSYLSQFAHARACDPVVVSGDYAYVTLRSGTECDGFNNQLDLVDISNITNPFLVKSFPMDNPHGLSIAENSLFLCEGEFGLKSFDITDPKVLGEHQLDHVTNLHAFDAIALPGQKKLLLVIGEDGFYQYNYDDPADLQFLSKITVN
ncbi:MAG: hypothetical protein HY842_19205 [Bacteroidetes bacterium]|nr:hypothetical protein [Bacteroidota bacterium]